MATFDQLSDEQRAIVELVLQQGKSYDELSQMLGIPEARVRERARDALVELAPVSARGVEEDWRGQLADYVLGQQAGPELTATRGHLRRSEAARRLDELAARLAGAALPERRRPGDPGRRARLAASGRGRPAPRRRRCRRGKSAGAERGGGGPAPARARRGRRGACGARRGAALADRAADGGRQRRWRVGEQGQHPDLDQATGVGDHRRAEGQDSDPGAGPRAQAEHQHDRLPGVAVRLELQAQVARGDRHRQEGQPPGDRRPPGRLQGLEVRRRDDGQHHRSGQGPQGRDRTVRAARPAGAREPAGPDREWPRTRPPCWPTSRCCRSPSRTADAAEPDALVRPASGRKPRVPGLGDVLPPQVGRVPGGVGRTCASGVQDELAAHARGRVAGPAREHGLGAIPGQRPRQGPRADAALLPAGAQERDRALRPHARRPSWRSSGGACTASTSTPATRRTD